MDYWLNEVEDKVKSIVFNLRFVIKPKNLFSLILSGLDFSGDPKKVTLQRMSEVVVTWCHYQSDHWPKSGG